MVFKFSLIAPHPHFYVTISSLFDLPHIPLTDAAVPISGADFTAEGGLLFEDHVGGEARAVGPVSREETSPGWFLATCTPCNREDFACKISSLPG